MATVETRRQTRSSASPEVAAPSVITRRRLHPDGEYRIEPEGETIVCVYLRSDVGRGLPLEQVADGRQREMTLWPGVIQVMPEGLPRIFRHHATADHIHLHLASRAIKAASEGLGLRSPELVPQLETPDLKAFHLAWALLDGDRGSENGRLRTESLSSALLAHLFARYGTADRRLRAPARLPQHVVDRITDYVESRLDEDISLEELAGVAGYARSRFSELFHATTGTSPYRFVVERRLCRARELLSRSKLPIAQVAAESGFYDQSHLTRHMRRQLGVTPGQLRP